MKQKFNPQPKPVGVQTKPKSLVAPPNPKIKPRPKIKPQPGYIRLPFILEHSDFYIICKCAHEKGLGDKNYSAALRLILREWKAWHDRQHHPVLIAVPPDMLPSQYQPDEES